MLFSSLEDEPEVEETNSDLLLQPSPSSSVMDQDSSSLQTAKQEASLVNELLKDNLEAQRGEERLKLPAEEKESLSSDVEIISDDSQETTPRQDDVLNTGFDLTYVIGLWSAQWL